jgi:hypothetical protein
MLAVELSEHPSSNFACDFLYYLSELLFFTAYSSIWNLQTDRGQ